MGSRQQRVHTTMTTDWLKDTGPLRGQANPNSAQALFRHTQVNATKCFRFIRRDPLLDNLDCPRYQREIHILSAMSPFKIVGAPARVNATKFSHPVH